MDIEIGSGNGDVISKMGTDLGASESFGTEGCVGPAEGAAAAAAHGSRY